MAELAEHNFLVFLPRNHDTCPRIVFEARMVGCNIILNQNVQHSKEEWWLEGGIEGTEEYLRGRPEAFWAKVDEVCG